MCCHPPRRTRECSNGCVRDAAVRADERCCGQGRFRAFAVALDHPRTTNPAHAWLVRHSQQRVPLLSQRSREIGGTAHNPGRRGAWVRLSSPAHVRSCAFSPQRTATRQPKLGARKPSRTTHCDRVSAQPRRLPTISGWFRRRCVLRRLRHTRFMSARSWRRVSAGSLLACEAPEVEQATGRWSRTERRLRLRRTGA